MLQGDAADVQQPLHLALGEVVYGFVAGQAVFVQAARLGLRIEDHHIVAQPRESVRTGQARRAGAHHGDALAGRRGAGEHLRLRAGHQRVYCVALQAANGDGRVGLGVAHAGLFAQHLGGADPGAHAAQRVGFQNRACRTPQIAVGNALDEAGHVDVGGAGGLAGRIKAVQAALGFEHGLGGVQWRGGIGKVLRVLGSTEAAGTDVRGGSFWHGNSCGWGKQVLALHQSAARGARHWLAGIQILTKWSRSANDIATAVPAP